MKWNGVAAVVNLIAKQLKTADSALMRQRRMTSTTAEKKRRSKVGIASSSAKSIATDTYIFSNGEKYSGSYMDLGQGKKERNGVGTNYFIDGKVYHGNWDKDKMNGQGEMSYPSGASYKGEFKMNQYHGVGTYTWPDGSYYTGPFQNNKMKGKGEFVDAEGSSWIGTFNERQGSELKLKLT